MEFGKKYEKKINLSLGPGYYSPKRILVQQTTPQLV